MKASTPGKQLSIRSFFGKRTRNDIDDSPSPTVESAPTPTPTPTPIKRIEAINETTSPSFKKVRLEKENTPSAKKQVIVEKSFQPRKEQDTWAHLNYDFLYPPNRLDIEKRNPEHPEYDENTLYVPTRFLNEQTPAMRQWWLIKQKNMNAILFFKMGKFYELFNQDAVTVVGITDIAFMKADDDRPAHAGFPEVSYDKYANMLIERGFKVLRIEQTETPAMMEERSKRTGQKSKFDKVVAREICQATTKGTQMMSVTDMVFHTFRNQYLLALSEGNPPNSSNATKEKVFGVCFVDVTIGKVHMGQFTDDRNRSALHTLLSHHSPVEILYEKGGLSDETLQVLKKSSAIKSVLKPDKEFWSTKTAFLYLKNNNIFQNEQGQFEWPNFLKAMFEFGQESDTLISLEPELDKYWAVRSFCAIVYYLQHHLIASQVLSCALFEEYESPQSKFEKYSKDTNITAPMILDHVALKNLEILENSCGGTSHTLLQSLNSCHTHFGQRLLKNWICSPLCDIEQINNRLDAVQVLIDNNNQSLMTELSATLKNIPDLERLLSRIKSQSFRSDAESRAILFENDQYSKKKINAFLSLLQAFKRIRKSLISMRCSVKESGSDTLIKLMSFTSDGGLFPDYEETLEYFDKAFDHEEAKKSGKIIPELGVDEKFDRCQEKINKIESELDEYIEEQRSILRCRSVEYFGTGKNRFQLQVPENKCSNVPDEYRIESTRKGYKRYYTYYIDSRLQELMVAEEERDKALNDIMATIFGQFSRKFKLWAAAIECIAIVDVLQSLAKFARSLIASGLDVCRPSFDSESEIPFMKYKQGRHASLVKQKMDFVPNDLELNDCLVLLSGANMGGKSTIMRQTGTLAILAQLGSFVPASELSMTPVDRIFSRLGATDRIMEGESTFYTELIETSVMIDCATKRSLLLLDELGRGTSTFDGTAIAYSVVKEISENIRCRCLFSTHYHSLVEEFKNDPKVRLAHMACKVESDTNNDNSDTELEDPLRENITFLHKIAEGPAYKSYGFNVAKLAGIEPSIIKEAFDKARELELAHKVADELRRLQVNGGVMSKEEMKAQLLLKLSSK